MHSPGYLCDAVCMENIGSGTVSQNTENWSSNKKCWVKLHKITVIQLFYDPKDDWGICYDINIRYSIMGY